MRLSSMERYRSYHMFATIVDMLYALLCDSNAEWTPTELREAAMLAALKYETLHVRPIFVTRVNAFGVEQ